MQRRTLVLSIFFAASALSRGQGKGKGNSKGKGKGGGNSAAAARFGSRDSGYIVNYFYPAGSNGLPPGLAKRAGDLPPGLAKQLQRNGQLPPGLQKKLAPFPSDLEVRLGPAPTGCRRALLGTWALLIQDSSNVILDILDLTRR